MSAGRIRMASGVEAVGVADGFGVGVGVAGAGVGVVRPPQAASNREAISISRCFFRTELLRKKMGVFYLILNHQSALSGAL
jgi:hypothetical protein